MEQENIQRRKTTNVSKTKTFLAVILGICMILFAIVDGYLIYSMHQSNQTETYRGKDEDKKASSSGEDSEEEKSEATATASMNGFVAGDSSVATQPQDAQPTATPAASEKSATKNNGISNEDYILPDSDKKYYSKKDLDKLTRKEVKLARNEIYARHGRKFVKDMTVKKYFEGKDWYSGMVDEVEDSELNKFEIANRDLIVKYEKKKKWN